MSCPRKQCSALARAATIRPAHLPHITEKKGIFSLAVISCRQLFPLIVYIDYIKLLNYIVCIVYIIYLGRGRCCGIKCTVSGHKFKRKEIKLKLSKVRTNVLRPISSLDELTDDKFVQDIILGMSPCPSSELVQYLNFFVSQDRDHKIFWSRPQKMLEWTAVTSELVCLELIAMSRVTCYMKSRSKWTPAVPAWATTKNTKLWNTPVKDIEQKNSFWLDQLSITLCT